MDNSGLAPTFREMHRKASPFGALLYSYLIQAMLGITVLD